MGATKRTLHVPSTKGMKLVSVRASLRGKSLPVHARSIKVDLRGKVVGNYNVSIVAKYKTKSGKVHTVRSTRSLGARRGRHRHDGSSESGDEQEHHLIHDYEPTSTHESRNLPAHAVCDP